MPGYGNSDVSIISTKKYNESHETVKFIGNWYNPGSGACWTTFDGYAIDNFGSSAEKIKIAELTEINFKYNIVFGDSFSCAGVIFGLEGVENTSTEITGYFLSFNIINPIDGCGRGNIFFAQHSPGSLWKFTYKKGYNTTELDAYVRYQSDSKF